MIFKMTNLIRNELQHCDSYGRIFVWYKPLCVLAIPALPRECVWFTGWNFKYFLSGLKPGRNKITQKQAL